MNLGILQARSSSKRLPGKVLAPILGIPMIMRQVERLRRCRRLDHLVLATSSDPSDDALAALCAQNNVECLRGSLDDVLDRFYQAAMLHTPSDIVRLTGDCPLVESPLVDDILDFHKEGDYDYSSNTIEPTYPDGLDVEVFRFSCLVDAWKEARTSFQREHVTPFFYQHPERFRLGNFKGPQTLSHLRWTVDEQEDLELIRQIYERLYPVNPAFGMKEILSLLNREPKLKTMNASHQRNEGLLLP